MKPALALVVLSLAICSPRPAGPDSTALSGESSWTTVRITPPSTPLGHPWSIRLLRMEAGDQPAVITGETDGAGVWRPAEVDHGRYVLEITDGQGSRWHLQPAEISGMKIDFTIQLSLVPVRGKITFGGAPVAAQLWFGGKGGTPRVLVSSRADGSFEGVVARAEPPWRVDIETDEPALRTTVYDVEVGPNAESPRPIHLDLPNRRIEGRVETAGGEAPSERVWVMLQGATGPHPPMQLPVGDDGRFIIGPIMDPGTYFLQALILGDSPLSSRRVALQVPSDEHPIPFQTLTLREERLLTGTVVSDAGPVADVRLFATPTVNGTPVTTLQPEARTDAAGTFEIRIPPEAEQLKLVVAADGFPLQVLSTDPLVEVPITIPLGTEGGLLRLHFPPELSIVDLDNQYYFLRGDLPLLVGELLKGGRIVAPGVLEVSSLEPGEITLCSRTSQGPRCEQVVVVPRRGQLDLHLPALPEEGP